MKITVSESYNHLEGQITFFLNNFDNQGNVFINGNRNKIKTFEIESDKMNVKSFKVPNIFNRLVYRWFRKSKAERSFCNAQKLLEKGIQTPYPIAYAEERDGVFLNKSFYISKHLQNDITYRTLVHDEDFPGRENIIRAFTRFTLELHNKDIQFLDHSPGNTLINLTQKGITFFLVDLNRMRFKKMSFQDRMKNFHRLTPKRGMVEIMANEYSKFIPEGEDVIFDQMWLYINKFQNRAARKKRIKKYLGLG